MTLNPGTGFALPSALSLDLYTQQNAGLRPGPKHQVVQAAKKGAPWSDEEHKAFLNGLKMYGRGQWKQISRYYVPSRTPTQVASHAQKHFLRQSGAQKRRSRFSAVEEAAMASAAAAPPGPALAALQHAAAMPPPATGVPGLFGRPLPPAACAPQPFSMLTQQPRLVMRSTLPAPGTMRGGIAMGMPIGVLPPLPSITTASGTELPILPVMPGRINALTSSVAPPVPAPAAGPTYSHSYSGDSSGSEITASKPPSPAPMGPLPRFAAAECAATGAPSGAAHYPAQYAPSGRSQQLLRLLELNELNEQLAAADRGSCGGDALAAAAAQLQPSGTSQSGLSAQQAQAPQQQWSMRRVQSATAALDALASLAEAEAQSDEEAAAGAQGIPLQLPGTALVRAF